MMEQSNWEEVIRIRDLINSLLVEDLTGFKIRSKFQHGPETERSSLFHAGRELKNHKSVNCGLKIGGDIVKDKNKIEDEVLHFFNALFNGHHGPDLVDRGVPFVPNWSNVGELFDGISEISNSEKITLISRHRIILL